MVMVVAVIMVMVVVVGYVPNDELIGPRERARNARPYISVVGLAIPISPVTIVVDRAEVRRGACSSRCCAYIVTS
jgi:hypothetical protein